MAPRSFVNWDLDLAFEFIGVVVVDAAAAVVVVDVFVKTPFSAVTDLISSFLYFDFMDSTFFLSTLLSAILVKGVVPPRPGVRLYRRRHRRHRHRH